MSLSAALARRMVQVSGVLTLARVAAAGFTFVFQALLARWMGADGLGVYVLATSLAAVLAIGVTLGFGAVTSRFVAAYRTHGREDLIAGFRRASFAHLVAASLLLVGGGLAALYLLPGLASPEMREPLAIGLLAAPVLALIRLNGAYANVNRRFFVGFLPDILIRPLLQLLFLAPALLLMAAGAPATAVWIFLFAALLAALVQWIMVRRLIAAPVAAPPAYERSLWLKAGLPMSVSVLLMTYLAEVDVLLLSAFLEPDRIAVFSICVRLVAFVSFAIYAVYQVMLPDLSEAWAQEDPARIAAAVRRANLLCTAVASAAFAGAALFGPWVLAVFGPEFGAGYRPLLMVAAAQVLVAMAGPGAQVLTVAGEHNRCVAAYATGLALIAALNALLVPPLGVEGAALAYACGMSLSALLLWHFARARLALDVSLFAALARVPAIPRTRYNPPTAP